MTLKRGLYVYVTINMVLFLLFTFASLLIVEVVGEYEKRAALEEAKLRAEMILHRNLATHAYFSRELKPSVFEIINQKKPAGYFEPKWMSSTYAVREIDKIFQNNAAFADYYYKEAAINARNPQNEADEIEKNFLDALNAGTGPEELAGERMIEGKPYFVVMMKGETTEQGCMMCHSTPDAAPAGLISIYGDQRAFDREVGKVVSAISIRIPMMDAVKRAADLTDRLTTILISILAFLLFCQIYITTRLTRSNDRLAMEIADRKAAEAALSQAVADKDMLIREVHHRVKNNLSVIQSLLGLQTSSIADEGSRELFRESQNRVKVMSMIHEALYKSDNVKNISAKEYIASLVAFLGYAYGEKKVAIKTEIDSIHLDVDLLVPCGLLVNELVSNSMKHAFGGMSGGEVRVSLKAAGSDGRIRLAVSDNGAGLPADRDVFQSTSLGMRLIKALAEQLGGELSVKSEGGTSITIEFNPALPED